MKHPSFTNQLYHPERVTQMEQNITDLKTYLAPDALENIVLQYRQVIEQSIEKSKFIPSTYLALKLAKVFQVPVEELFQLDTEFTPYNNPAV